MRRLSLWFLLAASLALAAFASSQKAAMFTQVEGKVWLNGAGPKKPARTLLTLSAGTRVQLEKGSEARLTYFSDGHQEVLSGPCVITVGEKGSAQTSGKPEAVVVKAVPGTRSLVPDGADLRRKGGSLQASVDEDSQEHQRLVAFVDTPKSGPGLITRSAVRPPPQPAPMFERQPGSESEPEPRAEADPPGSPHKLTSSSAFSFTPKFSWDGRGPYSVDVWTDGKPLWRRDTDRTELWYTGPDLDPDRDYFFRVIDHGTRGSQVASFRVLSSPRLRELQEVSREAARQINRDPKDATPLVLWASILAENQYQEQALVLIQDALRVAPEDIGLHLAAAQLCLELERTDEASQYLTRVRLLEGEH